MDECEKPACVDFNTKILIYFQTCLCFSKNALSLDGKDIMGKLEYSSRDDHLHVTSSIGSSGWLKFLNEHSITLYRLHNLEVELTAKSCLGAGWFFLFNVFFNS